MGLDARNELANLVAQRPQRLMLYRHEDATGTSGTGAVASGVVWPDGHVALRWKADDPDATSSTSLWSSVADLLRVHGHGGRSEIVYLDPDEVSHSEVPDPSVVGCDKIESCCRRYHVLSGW